MAAPVQADDRRAPLFLALVLAVLVEGAVIGGVSAYLAKPPMPVLPPAAVTIDLTQAPPLPVPEPPAPEPPPTPTPPQPEPVKPPPPKVEPPKPEPSKPQPPKPHPPVQKVAPPPPIPVPAGPVSDAPLDFAVPKPQESPPPPPPVASAAAASIKDIFEAKLHEAVQGATQYPAAARMMRLSGRPRVGFVYRDGQVSNVHLVQSCGRDLLDQAALAAVRNAAYPPAPPDLAGHELDLTVTVNLSSQ
jgi:protein TonB